MAWADVEAEIAHVDKLIHCVIVARDDARAHGNQALMDADDAKLDELLEFRHTLIPAPREPAE